LRHNRACTPPEPGRTSTHREYWSTKANSVPLAVPKPLGYQAALQRLHIGPGSRLQGISQISLSPNWPVMDGWTAFPRLGGAATPNGITRGSAVTASARTAVGRGRPFRNLL